MTVQYLEPILETNVPDGAGLEGKTDENGFLLHPPLRANIPPGFSPPRVFPTTGSLDGIRWSLFPRFENLAAWDITDSVKKFYDENDPNGPKHLAYNDFGRDGCSFSNIGVTGIPPGTFVEPVEKLDIFLGFRELGIKKMPMKFYTGPNQFTIFPPGPGIWRWPVKLLTPITEVGSINLTQWKPPNNLQPRFERVPVTTRENFPAVPDTLLNDDCTWKYVDGVTKTAFRKDRDGRIYVHWDSGPDESGIVFYNQSEYNTFGLFFWEIVVDYLIPGGSIQVEESDGTLILEITKAGRYSGKSTLPGPRIMTGKKPPHFSSSFQGEGWGTEHVISYFYNAPDRAFPCINPNNFTLDFFWVCDGKYTDMILNQTSLSASRVGQTVKTPNGLVALPGQQILFGETPPITGFYHVGDICYNTSPTGDNWAWRCTDYGNPGLWEPVPAPAPVVPPGP
jgi:hypothetical protein